MSDTRNTAPLSLKCESPACIAPRRPVTISGGHVPATPIHACCPAPR